MFVLKTQLTVLLLMCVLFLQGQSNFRKYPSKIKEVPLKNIRAAYQWHPNDQRWLQVLQGNNVLCVDLKGNEVKEPSPKDPVLWCGTLPVFRYCIDKENNQIIYESDHVDFGPNRKILNTTLDNIDAEQIKFLNGEDLSQYEIGDGLGELYHVPKYWILIVKGEKYGLAGIDHGQDDKISLKALLPMVYDSIVFKDYLTPLKLKKNGLYTWYLGDEKPKYKSLSSFDHHFSRFELPDGRKGWIDLNGNEYIDQ
ncbi:hypothetical protein [Sinomicrobium weinanense]|uniref:WG repeat-containing protein n=1 Tax=Sinomicrobium weinanense TaxID=2842200 RepID=A0A926Q5S3_9FLAO|nr:hypothetical protein [Sinomicrobium weinanense]MBC9798461.1 hypothetical protein [Sinomicrobium weinanense]MBU3126002.1 hypothetical protein [Sinomicrobium weinanense]